MRWPGGGTSRPDSEHLTVPGAAVLDGPADMFISASDNTYTLAVRVVFALRQPGPSVSGERPGPPPTCCRASWYRNCSRQVQKTSAPQAFSRPTRGWRSR